MEFKEAFDTFSQKNILIVGDVMVDAYVNGGVSRVSPEAPVPIVNLKNRENRLGGAANVALNIASLGATPIICAVVGPDYDGEVLKELLVEAHLDTSGILVDVDRRTTKKTRVIADHQQMLRIDKEDVHDLKESMAENFINNIKKIISSRHIDAIIFEDYNKGLLSEKVITELITFANENGVITAVDPKDKNFFAYKNVTLFKPNLKELSEGVKLDCNPLDKEQFLKGIQILEEQINPTYSFVTLSEHGVFIKNDGTHHFIPAHYRDIADVSGAGDTVISVATLALVSGLPAERIAQIANLAGGMVCEQVGVVSINKEQLLEESKKLLS